MQQILEIVSYLQLSPGEGGGGRTKNLVDVFQNKTSYITGFTFGLPLRQYDYIGKENLLE